ncbi:MAG: hypothetical protein JWL89_366 [Candidatus Saccharibacteria bacterium]|nr:hypothetical protein [Candidatus Saccharibacteria bacterium]
MRPLMELIGNPQERLRVVHLAGTSGKTSTAYYVAALLRAAGKTVGLTVSPHIDSVTERVQINGQPMGEVDFCRELSEFIEIIERSGQKPTYYELLVAFALWTFDRQGIEYAVLETGLGGLHDATNIANRPDKVCIITDIGYDHMSILGDTLEAIAVQKAGIIHPGNQVFMYEQADAVMTAIKQWVETHEAKLHATTQTTQTDLTKDFPANMPLYQVHNWLLAYYAYKYLVNRDNLQHLTRQVLAKTWQTYVPARMDRQIINGKTIIMDGAHNQQKMTAFLASFKQQYPDQSVAILIALKEGKEYQDVVPLVQKIAKTIIVTTFDALQDLRVFSMDPHTLADEFRKAGARNVQVVPDKQDALKALLATTEDLGIITGSFYLLSQIRNNGHTV